MWKDKHHQWQYSSKLVARGYWIRLGSNPTGLNFSESANGVADFFIL